MNQSLLGQLYGISVGTGDPDLITIKSLNILKQTEIIAFPQGIRGKKGFAETIISQWVEGKTLLPLDFPYVHDETVLMTAWKTSAERIWEYLQQGKDVVFACEGDIHFYSTFTYLAEVFKKNYPQVNLITIPGVCSPLATASVLGIPLTVKDQKLVILPALYHAQELQSILQWSDVIVLMKFRLVYESIWTVLKQENLLESSYIVEWATLPQQRIIRGLQDYPQLELSYFSIMVIQKP